MELPHEPDGFEGFEPPPVGDPADPEIPQGNPPPEPVPDRVRFDNGTGTPPGFVGPGGMPFIPDGDGNQGAFDAAVGPLDIESAVGPLDVDAAVGPLDHPDFLPADSRGGGGIGSVDRQAAVDRSLPVPTPRNPPSLTFLVPFGGAIAVVLLLMVGGFISGVLPNDWLCASSGLPFIVCDNPPTIALPVDPAGACGMACDLEVGAACPDGFDCISGSCQNSEICMNTCGQTCTSDLECGGLSCIPDAGEFGSSSASCGDGDSCICYNFTTCSAPGPSACGFSCNSSQECPIGLQCRFGACVSRDSDYCEGCGIDCTSNRDCSPGFACVSNAIYDPVSGSFNGSSCWNVDTCGPLPDYAEEGLPALPVCGDGVCAFTESTTCPADCSPVTCDLDATCGNGVCDGLCESADNCSSDCADSSGSGSSAPCECRGTDLYCGDFLTFRNAAQCAGGGGDEEEPDNDGICADKGGIAWTNSYCGCEGQLYDTIGCADNPDTPILVPSGSSCTPDPAQCQDTGNGPSKPSSGSGDGGGENDVCQSVVCGDGTCSFSCGETSISCPKDCFG